MGNFVKLGVNYVNGDHPLSLKRTMKLRKGLHFFFAGGCFPRRPNGGFFVRSFSISSVAIAAASASAAFGDLPDVGDWPSPPCSSPMSPPFSATSSPTPTFGGGGASAFHFAVCSGV